jgi:hypothetical protein
MLRSTHLKCMVFGLFYDAFRIKTIKCSAFPTNKKWFGSEIDTFTKYNFRLLAYFPYLSRV